MLHSEDDAVTPIAGAHRVVEALGGALVTVGGGDHEQVRPVALRDDVDDMISTAVTEGPQ